MQILYTISIPPKRFYFTLHFMNGMILHLVLEIRLLFRYILKWFLKKNQATILPPFILGIIFFLQNGCPITNCFVTDNKTLLGSKSINQFDALIFHPRDMTPKENGVFMIPNQKKRQPHQNYVMFMVESSSHDNLDYHKFQDFFNWTMTFRRDSDFYRFVLIFSDTDEWHLLVLYF